MTNWKSDVTKEKNGSFFALVVRECTNGEIVVSRGYSGRYFKTEKAALKSTNNHIVKHKMNEGQ